MKGAKAMKEAKRNDRKRAKQLRDLADRDLAAFELAWNKRLNSYAQAIRREAGVLRTHDGYPAQSVFDLIERAVALLESVGEDIAEKYGKQTRDFLTHTAIKAFAMNTGNPQLYRLRPAVH